MVLFAEAFVDQVDVVKSTLDNFCATYGHKVSVSKTQICFSSNYSVDASEQITSMFGFEMVGDLGKYLGVPLLHNRVTASTYAFLLDKIRARLQGWAANTLSIAGRITLAKAVLQAIPVYVMQSAWLPKRICGEIEKIIRRFVWGSKDGKASVSLVSWKVMQCSIDDGGLDFKDIYQHNRAFLMKI
ncbi:hypothetical protein GQ457_04G022330 [Hibiscus cannabinus]